MSKTNQPCEVYSYTGDTGPWNEVFVKLMTRNLSKKTLEKWYVIVYELWAAGMLNQKFSTQTGRRFNELVTAELKLELVTLKETIEVK